MLLHCPCGKSYLLHGANLEARELGPALSLTPTATESTFVTQTVPYIEPEATEAGLVAKRAAPDLNTATQTVLHTEPEAAKPAPAAKPAAPDLESVTQTALHTEPEAREPVPVAKQTASDLESATQTVLHTDVLPSETEPTPVPRVPAPEALTQTDREQQQSLFGEAPSTLIPTSVTTDLSTVELYFIDGKERSISFWNAVGRQPDRRWRLKPHAKLAFGFTERDHRGLGGTPGRWRDYYGDQGPSKFGYDSNLVVMSWEHKEGKGRVVPVGLLDDLVGPNWKEKLQQMRAGKR